MMENRIFATGLRLAAGFVAVAGVLLLSACGGGSGAPNNPYDPGTPAPAALTVLPTLSTAYQNLPITLTVSGGVPPYRAFSSNSTVLPVTQAVAGSSIVLIANAVATDTTVNITVQDSTGLSTIAQVLVKPAPLLPNLITITPNTDCPVGSVLAGNLCSGGTGTAVVVVTGPGGAGIPGRQVRFDVVSGNFGIQSNNPAQPLVQTLTVVTDANGQAIVGIAIPVNSPTQIGQLRATDITTGSQVTGQFTAQQVTDGSSILSVVPNGNTTFTGPLKGFCAVGGRVRHYIYGGTPPYSVRPTFPDVVIVTGDQPITGGVLVKTNGGFFDTVTNGLCFINLTFAITDATGRTIPASATPTVTNQEGSTDPTPTPAPPALQIAPTSVATNACTGKTFQFFATGGTPSYSAILTPNNGAITVNNSNGVVTVTGLADGSGTSTVTVTDQSNPGKTASATITCGAGATATLTIVRAGSGAAQTTVSSNVGAINCGSTCADSYPVGTPVILSAVTLGGSTFTGWSGGGCSGTGTCSLTLSANTTVTATTTTP
jgi:hypothetical protein